MDCDNNKDNNKMSCGFFMSVLHKKEKKELVKSLFVKIDIHLIFKH